MLSEGRGGKTAFDEAEFRRQVKDCSAVQIGDKDTPSVLAFTAVILSSIGYYIDDIDADKDGNVIEKAKERIWKRLERGNFSLCRIDITGVAVPYNGLVVRGVKVNIVTSDNGAINQTHPYERDFAMIVADFCKCYSKRYEERGEPPIVFAESAQRFLDELNRITAETERKDAVRKSNEERLACERWKNGYCVPCKFDCPHYKIGKCVEVS